MALEPSVVKTWSSTADKSVLAGQKPMPTSMMRAGDSGPVVCIALCTSKPPGRCKRAPRTPRPSRARGRRHLSIDRVARGQWPIEDRPLDHPREVLVVALVGQGHGTEGHVVAGCEHPDAVQVAIPPPGERETEPANDDVARGDVGRHDRAAVVFDDAARHAHGA